MVRRSALLVWLSCFLATDAGAATKTWTGAVNNLWSVGGNWNDGLPPADGDSMVFPNGAANRTMVNDLTGLDLASISFAAASYNASGNAITLSGGLTTICCSSPPIVWSVPITLMASQTFGGPLGGVLDLAGPVDRNGHALTIQPYVTAFSGSLIGSGAVIVTWIGLNFTGTASFAGGLTLSNGGMNVDGSLGSTTLSGNGSLSGSGTIPVTSLISSTVRPGSDPGSFCCADPHTTAILTSGSFSMSGGTLGIDISGTTPGASYDQRAVTGGVTLLDPTLQVTLDGFAPLPGQTFVIIANDGADAVSGTFSGRPEGAVFTVSGTPFRITYAGNDGNDVVLTALAPTTTTLTSSQNPTVSGETFTLTAVVTSPSGTPAGSVRFLEGIDYTTADGTATAGTDYVPASGTVEFAPGVTSRTITITILGDTTPEEVETFRLLLSNPQNAVLEDGEAVISITDTAAIPTAGTVGPILLGLILAAAGLVAVRP